MSDLEALRKRARRRLRGPAVGLVVLVVVGFWIWRQGAERRAVSHLPDPERAEVYRLELESFRRLCGQGPRTDALEARCRERAEFILNFPLCDVACQALARSHTQTEGKVEAF